MIHTPPLQLETDPERYWSLIEEFWGGEGAAAHVFELGWEYGTIAGAGGSQGMRDPSDATQYGVARATTGATNGDILGYSACGTQTLMTRLPQMRWKYKFRFSDITNCHGFVGLARGATEGYRAADNVHACGLRYDSAIDGNFYALAKRGTAGGGWETTLLLGAADTDWHIVEFYLRTSDVLDVYFDHELIGQLDTTNFSSATLVCPKMGLGTLENVVKHLYFDFFAAWGPRQ